MILALLLLASVIGTALVVTFFTLLSTIVPLSRAVLAVFGAIASAGALSVALSLSRSPHSDVGGLLVQLVFVIITCSLGVPLGWQLAKLGLGPWDRLLNGVRIVFGLATAIWIMPGSCVAVLTGLENEDAPRIWLYVLVPLFTLWVTASLACTQRRR